MATDLHSRRIPNVLTGVGILAGVRSTRSASASTACTRAARVSPPPSRAAGTVRLGRHRRRRRQDDGRRRRAARPARHGRRPAGGPDPGRHRHGRPPGPPRPAARDRAHHRHDGRRPAPSAARSSRYAFPIRRPAPSLCRTASPSALAHSWPCSRLEAWEHEEQTQHTAPARPGARRDGHWSSSPSSPSPWASSSSAGPG